MAACTFRVGTADTGNTPNASGAFTPSLGDLLVVFVVVSDVATANVASGTLTCSTGMTFDKDTTNWIASFASSAHQVYMFVSTSLVSSAVSQTVTFDNAADTGSGTVIFVFSVSGMTNVGAAAVRQVGKQSNVSGTPGPAFGSNALTGNPILGCVGNSTSPAGMTAPTGWTEPAGGDLGYSTPTTGGEVVSRDSGFTSTNVTWGSASASNCGAIVAELDASVPSGQPTHRRWGGVPGMGGMPNTHNIGRSW
jgi:hypothetical protein